MDYEQTYNVIDDDLREAGLSSLRKKNFEQLCRKITMIKAPGASLLEVGSAHGWFLEIAQRSYRILGIEPERRMVELSLNRGFPIRPGSFPGALQYGEQFDIIVFNDVFEHLPNVQEALKTCHSHLKEQGILVLNLPNSNGLIYILARAMIRLGIGCFFERIWQKNLPTPHLHYFNRENLRKILDNFGFSEVTFGYLDVFHFKGLKERLMACKNFPYYAQIFALTICAIFYPVMSMARDNMYLIAKKK